MSIRLEKKIPEATGDIIKQYLHLRRKRVFQINLEMTEEGAKRFRLVTEKLVNKPLAIVLMESYTSPTINEPLSVLHEVFSKRSD